MAGNGERFLAALRESGAALCDDDVTKRAGFGYRQVAFQVGERLAGRGTIGRAKGIRCGDCQGIKKCSWLPEAAPADAPATLGAPPERRFVPAGVPAGGLASSRAAEFEATARPVLSEKYATFLAPGTVGSVAKVFDFVSADRRIVGDAKFYSLVHGSGLPPAKFSTIAEHVWLLEKTRAAHRFLVFGNDRRVPRLWLDRFGSLVDGVAFFFLGGDGRLESLREE